MNVFLSVLMGLDKTMKFLLVFQVISVIAVIMLNAYQGKKYGKLILTVGFIPLIVFLIFYGLNYIKGNSFFSYQRYAGIFCSSVIILLLSVALYFKKSSVFYSVVSSVLVILCCAETLYAILIANFSPYLSNYSHYGWSESFEKTIDELEKSYILRDWKQIDFDSLRSELIPRVEKAEKDNDVEEFALALYELKFYLNDGHVWVPGSDYSALNNVEMSFCGNDYGFSMFRDNTGKILAVLTEESSEAEKYGIHDGIQITKWNCETVDEAAAKVRCFDTEYNFSYVENEEIFQPVFLAGKGGDTVNVSFIDDNGDEKTVSLNKTGNYNSRLRKAIRKIYGYEIITSENLFTCMLNEKCGYLRVSNEALYGSDIKEILAMMNGEYPEFREEMENKIQKLEDQGMD